MNEILQKEIINDEDLYAVQYMDLYTSFVKDYHNNIANPIDAGHVLAQLAQHFASANSAMVRAERRFSAVARDIECRVDDVTQKPISSTKAKVLSDATPERATYEAARMHVQNIEQFINTIKTIAKLITNEYSVMKNI